MPKIVILSEGNTPREVILTAALTRIGRQPMQEVQVLDPLVSKEHARIVRQKDKFFIFDLNSRNGTFVNRRLVTSPLILNDGDEILVGTSRLRFVDETARQAVLKRVSIGPPTVLQSSIQKSLPSTSERIEFQPAAKVLDLEALRQDYDKLRMAYQLAQELALETRLEVLLDKILDSLFQSLNCDRAVILLYNETTKELEPRNLKTRQFSDEQICLSQTILTKIIDQRQSILSSDAQVDSRFASAQSIIIQGIRSTMTVPMVYRDRLIGAIHVDSLLMANAFSAKDLDILQGFCSQAALAIENARLVDQARQEATTREKFQRLLSPNLVEQVMNGNLEIRKGGERLDIAVLFADVRGFTSWTEREGPESVVTTLNEFFEIMVDVVFEHEGTLDKFIGDAILAFWGAPVSQPDMAFRALSAALKMQRVLQTYNRVLTGRGQRAIQLGIGLDVGPTIVGYMGSSKTMSFTVIGEHVNRASRLCNEARGGEILLTENVRLAAGDGFLYQLVANIQQLKGISKPMPYYRVMLPDEEDESDHTRSS